MRATSFLCLSAFALFPTVWTTLAFDMPRPTGYIKIDKPILVQSGQVFDGRGKQFDYRKNSGFCAGQSETSINMIMPGGTVKNVIVGPNQSEGIHCPEGSCTLENVWWSDVCEDALTINGDNVRGTRILGGGARNAHDKVIQHNGKGSVYIEGFQTKDVGKLYRSCGTCAPVTRSVTLKNVRAEGKALTLAGLNKDNGDKAVFLGRIVVSKQVTSVCETYVRPGGNKGPIVRASRGQGNGCNFEGRQVRSV